MLISSKLHSELAHFLTPSVTIPGKVEDKMAGHKAPKMSHVNLMADTVIANLPEEGLRSVLRSMLATDPSITAVFESRARHYLRKTAQKPKNELFEAEPTAELRLAQQRLRSMLGCGLCYEVVPVLISIVGAVGEFNERLFSEELTAMLSALDGDIIQTVTAVQKTLLSSSGARSLTPQERKPLLDLLEALRRLQTISQVDNDLHFHFERSLKAIEDLLGVKNSRSNAGEDFGYKYTVPSLPTSVETFVSLENGSCARGTRFWTN